MRMMRLSKRLAFFVAWTICSEVRAYPKNAKDKLQPPVETSARRLANCRASRAGEVGQCHASSAAAGYPGPNPETGPNATIGDVTKMYIAFDYYPAGTCGMGTPWSTSPTQVAVTSTSGVGTATATLSSSSEVSYCVVPRIVAGSGRGTNLYYMAPSVQPVGMDFYVNSGQVATGGGDPTGSHGNFSFNARYNSNGSPKGQKVYTYRGSYNRVPADFIITSNALTGLQFSEPDIRCPAVPSL